MTKEKIESAALVSVLLLCGGALLYLFFRYVFLLILPFLVGWGLAFATRKPSAFLSEKLGIPMRFVRVVLTVFVLLCSAAGLCVLFGKILSEIAGLLAKIDAGDLFRSVKPLLTPFASLFGREDVGLAESLDAAFASSLGTIFSKVTDFISAAVGGVPRALIFVLITVIASVYFAFDLENINRRVRSVLPQQVFLWLVRIKDGFLHTGGVYIRSYGILMLFTVSLMSVGLWLIGVEYAFLIAVLIAFLDLLPVLGVSTALLPWSAYCFLTGNATRGILLLVLLGVNEIIRQFIEPKILGKNLGMDPVMTLLLVYVGTSLFGVIGLFLLPICAVAFSLWRGDREGKTQSRDEKG